MGWNHSAAALKYRSVQAQTSSPGQLMLMLFDGLCRFVGEAEVAMRGSQRGVAGEKVSRAHAILEELTATLDPRHAPELCERLEEVYGFCMRELVASNARRDADGIARVLSLLAPLRDAWREAVGAARP